MHVTHEALDAATHVIIEGNVDASTSGALREYLDDLLSSGVESFVIDLAKVPFLDSSGLATLVHTFKRVRIGNGDVVLCSLQPDVLSLFELTRLTRVFTICDDVVSAEAVAAAAP
jgi:anti-sigma B factor antagonist